MSAPTAPRPERPRTTGRALRHVASVAVLGVLVVAAGGPVLVTSSFGGLPVLLLAFAVVTVVAVGLAALVDQVTGPADGDPSGPVRRGLAVGVIGTGTAGAVGVAVLWADDRSALPVPLLVVVAALAFPAVAGLQWPGAVRRWTAVVLTVGAVGVLAAWLPEADRERREDQVLTEVGTLARPWVTEVDGFDGPGPQTTGSELISTPYLPADGGTTAVFRVFRDAPAAVVGDPCTAATAPGITTGEPVVSCREVTPGRWAFTTGYSQVLLERADDGWVGVTADPDVPAALLDTALDGARPMTADEYDAWLDEVLSGA